MIGMSPIIEHLVTWPLADEKISSQGRVLIMLLDCAFRAGVRVEVVICTRVILHTSCFVEFIKLMEFCFTYGELRRAPYS